MGGTLLGGIMPFTFLEKNDIKSKFRLKKFLMTVIIVLANTNEGIATAKKFSPRNDSKQQFILIKNVFK